MKDSFYRFYFDESSALRSIDIYAVDFDSAYVFMCSIIPSDYKVVRYIFFPY